MLLGIELIILVLCILRLNFPISIGFAQQNMYVMVVNSIAINFVFVWAVMFCVLVLLHIIGKRVKRNLTDTKTDAVCIITSIITLILSIL